MRVGVWGYQRSMHGYGYQRRRPAEQMDTAHMHAYACLHAYQRRRPAKQMDTASPGEVDETSLEEEALRVPHLRGAI